MFETMKSALILSLTITSIVSSSALANDNIDASADETKTDTRPGIAPDIREDETKLKLQKGNFVVVPIPISNPTLDSGLVLGAADLRLSLLSPEELPVNSSVGWRSILVAVSIAPVFG